MKLLLLVVGLIASFNLFADADSEHWLTQKILQKEVQTQGKNHLIFLGKENAQTFILQGLTLKLHKGWKAIKEGNIITIWEDGDSESFKFENESSFRRAIRNANKQ